MSKEYKQFWKRFMGRTNDLLNQAHREINVDLMSDTELKIFQSWIDGMQIAVDALGQNDESEIKPTLLSVLRNQMEVVRSILNRDD